MDPAALPAARRRRARDRHGRGLRGPLVPATLRLAGLPPLRPPRSRSRAEAFDDLVRRALVDVEDHLDDDDPAREVLADLEVSVAEVPPVPDDDGVELVDDDADVVTDGRVALARVWPAVRGRPAQLLLYRRPVEARGPAEERADVVLDTVVEGLARLLARDVDALHPDPPPPEA